MNNTSKLMCYVSAFIAERGGTVGALEAIRATPAAPTRQARRARRLLLKYVLVFQEIERKRGVRS